MFDKRLMAMCPESKKYIAGNILLQWIELCLNAVMIGLIADSAQKLYRRELTPSGAAPALAIIAVTILIRFFITRYAVRMSYLASRTVKRKMRDLIYKKILKLIHDRQQALDAELDAAKKAKEEAQAIVDSSKETIDEAKRKGSEIVEEARATADKQSKQVIDQANNEAQQIIERAEEDAARMKRNAFETMKDDIADLSVQIAGHIIADAVSKDELRKSAAKHTEEILDKEVAKSE